MRFLALLLFFPSLAFGQWTTADTVRQGVFTGLTMIDWAQTRTIAKNPPIGVPGHYYLSETNPILGDHPSIGRVNSYFAATIIGHAAVSYMLPSAWREGWQYVWIGVEVQKTYHNHSIGIRLTF